MQKNNWVKVSDRLPPENKVVQTKIHKNRVVKNESKLVLKGTVWWLPDFSTNVQFNPTHWLDE